jgi:hypothetical protein
VRDIEVSDAICSRYMPYMPAATAPGSALAGGRLSGFRVVPDFCSRLRSRRSGRVSAPSDVGNRRGGPTGASTAAGRSSVESTAPVAWRMAVLAALRGVRRRPAGGSWVELGGVWPKREFRLKRLFLLKATAMSGKFFVRIASWVKICSCEILPRIGNQESAART